MFDARAERMRIDLPSGYHSATWSMPGWNVSLFGPPPAAGIVYASVLPSYSPVNATVLPSGENLGRSSSPSCVVSRCAVPPARATVQRSPAYTNTMRSPWMSGMRMRRHSSSAEAGRGASAEASAEQRRIVRSTRQVRGATGRSRGEHMGSRVSGLQRGGGVGRGLRVGPGERRSLVTAAWAGQADSAERCVGVAGLVFGGGGGGGGGPRGGGGGGAQSGAPRGGGSSSLRRALPAGRWTS